MVTEPQYEESRSIRRKLKKDGEKEPTPQEIALSKKMQLSKELLEAVQAAQIAENDARFYSFAIENDLTELLRLQSDQTLTDAEKENKLDTLQAQLNNHEFIFSKSVSTWVSNARKSDNLKKVIAEIDSRYF